MSDFKRQHAVTIVLGTMRGMLYILPPVFIIIFQNIGDGELRRGLLIAALIAVGAFLASLVYQVLKWYFYTYRHEEGYLHLKSGVIVKNERSIKQDRVQTVNIRRGILQRILGLASLQVETAGGGGESEFQLNAVKLEEAVKIKDSLEGFSQAGSGGAAAVAEQVNGPSTARDVSRSEEAAEESTVEYQVSLPELFLAGATSGRFLLLFSVIAAIFSQLVPFIPDTIWEDLVEQATTATVTPAAILAITAVLAVLMIISWLISTIAYVIQHYNFTVRRDNLKLEVSWGLVEQKQLNLKLHRLQALVIQEGLLRQPLGRCSLVAEVAGGGSKEQDYVTMLFPLLHRDQLQGFIGQLLPEYNVPDKFISLPRRSLRRYIIRALAPCLLFIIPLQWVPYGWVSLFLLFPAFFWGLSRYRAGGTVLEGKQLAYRFRFVNRYRVLMKRNCIQSLQVVSNPFQRRQKLKTVRAWVLSSPAGKMYQVVDVEEQEAQLLWNWFSRARDGYDL